ncbi:MAG: phosphoribosylglycinamide formyltransferase [Thermoplasmatota archaeon]
MINIGVLASGSGTDFQSIIDGVESGMIDGEIKLLITNNPEAYCIERAKKHDIDFKIIDHRDKTRKEHEKLVSEDIENYELDLIVLAGYMRMLTDYFVDKYYGKMINIHPALLPLFGGEGMYGDNVHKAVLESGMKRSGCSVHFVTNEVDMGPIIDQRCVPVKPDDDIDTLSSRVLEKEHELLPEVVKAFSEGRVELEDEETFIIPPEKDNNK